MNTASDTAGGEDRLALAHEQLTAAVEQLVSSEDWARMLEVAARFHRYSLNNVLLVHAQMPEATRLAGYRAWQALGRQVRRGEHGLSIFAPVLRRVPPDSASELARHEASESQHAQASPSSRQLVAFKVSKVFDISQTEGPPLPDVAPELLGGEAPSALYAGLAAEVEACGCVLLRQDCSPANGRTDFSARTVTVRADCSDAQAAKTLAHELGHVRLHDDANHHGLAGISCRGLAEVEAESVAFLVCQAAGLPTGEYSFPYVARWANGDLGMVRSAAGRSLAAARAITSSLGLTPNAPEPASEAVLARLPDPEANRIAELPPSPVPATSLHIHRSVGR